MADEPLPDHRSLARQHLEQVRRASPASTAELAQPHRGQRRPLGGLDQHRVARGERGREPPRGDGHREVPRGDDPDHPERLVERDVETARDRNLLAGQPFRAGRVELQHVADVARPPTRALPIGCPELATSSAASSSTWASTTAANARSAAARSAGASSGPALLGGLRAGDRVVDRGHVELLDGAQHLLGRRVDQLSTAAHRAHFLCARRRAAAPTSPRTAAGRRAVPRDATARPRPSCAGVAPGRVSTASITPSVSPGADDQPVPEPVDGLVVVALRVGGLADQRRHPGAGHRRDRRRAEHRVARWCPVWPTTSGRCWCSVPPSATLSTCAPRQMPSTGMPRANAPLQQRELPGVAVASAGLVGRRGAAAWP